MATHVIEIDPFNPISVWLANRAINEHVRQFNENVDRYLRGLAEIGEKAAQGKYSGTPVTISVKQIENGYAVSADGKEVAFLEFGAGSTVNTANRYADDMPFEVRQGSYSDSKDPPGEYAQTGYKFWHLGKTLMTHVDPRNGVQAAYDAIIQDMKNLAEVVFS